MPVAHTNSNSNSALAMHRHQFKFKSKFRESQANQLFGEPKLDVRPNKLANKLEGRDQDPVEYHYKVALKLRPNFALAALNLGAWQYDALNQLAEARQSFIERCAMGTRAEVSKAFHQHVRAQIECLISGSKLYLDEPGPRAGGQTTTTTTTAGGGAPPASHANSNGSRELDEKCSLILNWMRLARAKAKQIGWSDDGDQLGRVPRAGGGPAAPSGSVPGQMGDLNKQLALIHWIQSKCDQNSRGILLERAAKYAHMSQNGVEADVYLDYANWMRANKVTTATGAGPAQFLETTIGIERQKKGRLAPSARQLVRLLDGLARQLVAPGDALHWVEEAIELEPDNVNLISAAGRLAYESGQLGRSESLYGRALGLLLASAAPTHGQCDRPTCLGADGGPTTMCKDGKRIASAHTNYGAILQLNGRLVEARYHYRRALDCDPNNSVAATNLGRLLAAA